MSIYVTDTHPLIWYATGKHSQLSKKALSAFNAAIRNEALIYVPPFVMWEIAMLLKVGRIKLQEDFGNWAEKLMAQRGFDLAGFSIAVATEAFYYPFPDPFDGVIAATAKIMDLPLITKDREISGSQYVEVHW
ncbi:MAG: type II toxin-antitoxin system VapC family toxin [Blastocatellia bacterium]|nr:type II toxin-antitoxin system VapC family toxin [Blastocatellia bacterium]